MAEYLVPAGFGEAEFVEKRSRFIGRVWLTETEEEALARIKETRERHWDATHNVYAYIIRDGGAMRYSDDGEPQGTSGLPVLGVFRAGGITNFCCVVTRYFGGVLLGTGGLVRAYSHTASLALAAAGTAEERLWRRFELACPYALFERVKKEISFCGGDVESSEFGADVRIRALFPERDADAFRLRLTEATAGTVAAADAGELRRAVRIDAK